MKTEYRYLTNALCGVFLCFCMQSCVEPFEVETKAFEDIIVIDASITDETKTQEVFISRTFLSGQEIVQETGALVSVVDDTGTRYQFREERPGHYISTTEFGAIPERKYRLVIQNRDGRTYTSEDIELPAISQIDTVEAIKTTNEDGVDGVAILANSIGNNEETGFYRYEYEETYRIRSFYNPIKELVIVSENPPTLELVDKTRQEQICYQTQISTNIAIADTDNFSENRVSDFQIRFIEQRDRIIAERYSILVKQFSQSKVANEFYKRLQEFSGNENLFSQTQPGFIGGNIFSEENQNEKILGLFEVTSVSSKRIFFDFDDIFGSVAIRFFDICPRRPLSPSDPFLFSLIRSGEWRYVSEDPPNVYNIAPVRCVDCTRLGSNTVPDFWED